MNKSLEVSLSYHPYVSEWPTNAKPMERRVLRAEAHFFETFDRAAMLGDKLRKAINALDPSRPGSAEATKRLEAALEQFRDIPTSVVGRSTKALAELQDSSARHESAIALAEVTLAAVCRIHGITIR